MRRRIPEAALVAQQSLPLVTREFDSDARSTRAGDISQRVTPSAQKVLRHLATIDGEVFSRLATSLFESPSAHARMMAARAQSRGSSSSRSKRNSARCLLVSRTGSGIESLRRLKE